MAEPVRTCIGCGGKAAQRELVRLRNEGGRVIVDRKRQGGRGAWLHPSAACLEAALRRRAFARALRSSVVADAAALHVGLTGNGRND